MCARSQHNGDMSSDTCTCWRSSGTGASNARVRRRLSSSAAAISGLVTISDAGALQARPVFQLLVGRAAAPRDVPVEVLVGCGARLVVGTEAVERGPGGVEAPSRGDVERRIAQCVACGRGPPVPHRGAARRGAIGAGGGA